MSLRVAVVQFSPKIGQVKGNIDTASKLVAKLEPDTVDLVCLPEMIFSGYVFPDVSAISPFLEDSQTGPTSHFCSDLAKRLRCYVIAGYPERLAPDEQRRPVLDQKPYQAITEEVGANSAILYGPTGEFISNYRKTNPFETDMTWSKPGTGFAVLKLPQPLRTVALGICMDLNTQPPAIWTLDGPYEIANFALEKKANILILLNAWLDSGEEPEEAKDWRTLNFWAARLRPLWATTEELEDEGEDSSSSDSGGEQRQTSVVDATAQGHETTVVICNRCGQENGKTFAGSSAVFSLQRGSGRPKLLHSMTRKAEGVEVWTV
ncbi:carbon-nitrogen hydrolase [Irpex rosettiformis]|uniref:Carbon-nitrogen hydrolase n=1 Tax=Irpex rosettiformis TaxID=378272 RepID=A0ACB8U0I1_9APHY|nr:carbon-nitrogen hydrolase [Irpex rosettiformis]